MGGTWQERNYQANEPVDAVYLWVDSNDPSFQTDYQSWFDARQEPDAIAARRFRDNEELRYSLRSLELHAPWINHVFIVTNGNAPLWINTNNPQISVVSHRQIFPDPTVLPVFNSYSIELNLHRIPGLSRKFLYLNDDFFLGRDVNRDNYFQADESQLFYFEPNPIFEPTNVSPVHDRADAYTGVIIDKHSKVKRTRKSEAAYSMRRSFKMLPLPLRQLLPAHRLLPGHIPQIYDCEILSYLERLFPEEFAITRAHRFRAADDLVIRILYAFFLLECEPEMLSLEPVVLNWESPDYHFIPMQGTLETVKAIFSRCATLNPRFICVNDDLGDAPADDPILTVLRGFLQAKYPLPSSFENLNGFDTDAFAARIEK
ncbi:MAG: stealth conserved region 3 domain-containing protein [Candidatus Riflebacteria bacterium]|nr:stealth conserved region 3 domain-containing protein [Candidatus Riflebacteria bacterium]